VTGTVVLPRTKVGGWSGPAPLDRVLYRIASTLMVAAGVVLAIGASLPWVTYGTAGARTAFQFGPHGSLTALGIVLVVCAAALVGFAALVLFHPIRPNLCLALLPTLGAGLMIVGSWQGRFGGVTGQPTTLGSGSFVCYAALGLGVLATLVLLPAEHAQR
jgi:hypothetical protein